MRGVFLKLYALLIAAGVISYLVQDYAMDRYWSSEQATWRHERMVSTHIVAEEALAVYAQALSLFRTVGDRLGEANTLKAQGKGATEIARELNIGRASVYRLLAGSDRVSG